MSNGIDVSARGKKNELFSKLPQLLVSCLVVGLVLFTVLGPSLREQLNGQPHKKRSLVRIQVINWERAAMAYAEHNAGIFPRTALDPVFRDYYCAQVGSKPGIPPTNPFSQKPEWPVDGEVIVIAKEKEQKAAVVAQGAVEYSAIYDQHDIPVGYRIRAGDECGKLLTSKEWRNPSGSNDE